MTDLNTLHSRQRWTAQLLTCRLDTTLREEYERRLVDVQTEIAGRTEIARQAHASLGQTARQSSRNDRACCNPALLVRRSMVGGDARMMMQSSKDLIDRGYAYMRRSVAVESAIKVLQSPEPHRSSTVAWALTVLESLPENEKAASGPNQ